MIDEDKTLQFYGYTSDQLKPQSNKFIIRLCDNCGIIDNVIFANYNKAKYPNLCKLCSQHTQQITLICKQCNKEYKVSPSKLISKFCSKKCHSKWKSENLINENNYNWKSKITLICQQCNKEYEVNPCHNNQKFCLLECKNKWQSINRQGDKNSAWKGGLTNQRYCNLFNNKFKEKIRQRYHRICYLCDKSEKDNNQKLSVHHVNYDKSCLCGATCEFIPLCGSCHTKTNHNRQYWEDMIMCYLYPNRYFMIDI